VFDDAQDDLLAIARLSDPVDAPSIDLRIDITNDPEETKTVWTDTGKTLIRDILSGNTPSWPQEYAYGSDTTSPQESDTSLGNEIVRQDLDRLLVQRLDSAADWDVNTTISENDPVGVNESGELELLQSSFFIDTATDVASLETNGTTVQDSGAVNGEVIELTERFDYAQNTIFLPYEIPDESLEFSARLKTPDGQGPELEMEAEFQSSGVAASCFQASDYTWFNAALGILGNRIGPGEVTVTIEVTEECLDGNGNPQPAYVDVFNIRDTRFNYTLDDTTDANDQLSGPEDYPDLFAFDGIDPAVARRDLDFALLEQVWDDTSNQQFIEVASDSGFTDSIRVDNSQVVDGTLNETREIYTRVGLSRYTSDSTTSPTSGDTGQAIDLQELFANPDAIGRSEIGEATLRAIISGRNAVGTTFAESGLFDQNGDLLTSGVVPEFQKIQDQLVISSERLRFEND